MRPFVCKFVFIFFAVALGNALPALGADVDSDALNLQSASPVSAQAMRDTRIYLEGALGNVGQRYQPDGRNFGRASLDFSHTARLGPGLRAVFSNRLDQIHPRDAGADETVNSLREAYLS